MAQRGVDLTKLPVVLLEKVEELTLHAIELDQQRAKQAELIQRQQFHIVALGSEVAQMNERLQRLEALLTKP